MAGIEEIGDETDMTSLGMNGVSSPVVVQAPVPPQFADEPSVEGTNENTSSIPLLCGTNANLNNIPDDQPLHSAQLGAKNTHSACMHTTVQAKLTPG